MTSKLVFPLSFSRPYCNGPTWDLPFLVTFVSLYIVLHAVNLQINSCISFREGSTSEVSCVCCWHVFLFPNVFTFPSPQFSLFVQVSYA